MNCPKCGGEIDAGKAYCADPACGAVISGNAQEEPGKATPKNNLIFILRPEGSFLLKVIVFFIVFLLVGYFKSR